MNDLGRYRIQAVAEMTGISAATLRQWERRYGVPSPNRTDSSYRVYGKRDIDQIRRIVALGDQGVSPSEAARLVLAEDARRDREKQAVITETGDGTTLLGELDPFVEARRRIIEALERYDFDRLAAVTRKLMYLGSAVSIYERVVAPTMREIGQRWHDGTLSVAQEHMASESLGQLVHQLLPLVQPEESDRVALLACMGEETHTLPLYGIAFRVAQWGFRSMVLGARTPPDAIASLVAHSAPTVIGLSVTVLPPDVPHTQRLVEAYAEAAGDVPWLVGGRGARAVAHMVRRAGGIAAPTDAAGLRELLERLAAGQRGARSG